MGRASIALLAVGCGAGVVDSDTSSCHCGCGFDPHPPFELDEAITVPDVRSVLRLLDLDSTDEAYCPDWCAQEVGLTEFGGYWTCTVTMPQTHTLASLEASRLGDDAILGRVACTGRLDLICD